MTNDLSPTNTGAQTAHRLLRLLREGAAPEAYQALLDGCSADELPCLGPLVEDALHVRAQLEERRRREDELAALYETAGDLSSLRDLEAVLQAIVRRARGLLGTDTAYLMLNDARRGDTYVRVTDGIRTDAFKHCRLAMGAGLGGLVAKTAVPYNTPDYLNDPRFAHTVDDVVRGEGLIAIQGVPLKLGKKVIGVLFAANRSARPFPEHEVALLVSLANHAAIAIENATLFQEVQRAVDDLTEANAVIQAHSASVEQAASLHERLTSIVLHGGGMADVAQNLAAVLGGSILVLAPDGRVMAGVGTDPVVEQAQAGGVLPEGSPAARAVHEACVLSAESRRTRRIPGTGAAASACATPITAGTEVLGSLALVRARLDAADVRSLERAALVTALMLLSERSVAEAEHRLRGEILEDLLGAPHRDLEGLRRRAALMGLDLGRPHTVLAARCRGGGHRRAIADAATAFAAHAKGLAGEYRGDVIVLLPGDDAPARTACSLADHLSRTVGGPVTVGSTSAAPGVDALVAAHRDAAQCLGVLLALDRDGEGASLDELGIYGLLFSQAGRDELQRFVRCVIGPVLDYDERRSGELVRTLLAYFDCDASLTRTAAGLFVHVNTLYQRIDRVTALLGPQWRHGDHALQVHLALKVHSVLSAH
ncbi:helix-turn-helix domain-containing protein [Streptomyces chiangmaiensis]|uniref:GAF domain-containing protein n=1 Tax=Streptomyces chiangmaiensis TaxID=766497 RepID=A0ABU7FS25_9ACTN|nr:GAF domain-containing protein [Streptomyces chiangmaiensis]MED7826905.1 GAF domain-containing protein [Streptomyces chiangmaiensis]